MLVIKHDLVRSRTECRRWYLLNTGDSLSFATSRTASFEESVGADCSRTKIDSVSHNQYTLTHIYSLFAHKLGTEHSVSKHVDRLDNPRHHGNEMADLNAKEASTLSLSESQTFVPYQEFTDQAKFKNEWNTMDKNKSSKDSQCGK
ncbi:hypothetical protein WN51_10319 [Melipona quadrifasciata]|uniref:Uncharacterized protein n=1 Tax=Melipona quadrifasciata TaxID=166423 RepID=A0A0M8ZMU4_9HYME|nr:hypothetical protein WN51_10319 [Melipona quadrifasciata]